MANPSYSPTLCTWPNSCQCQWHNTIFLFLQSLRPLKPRMYCAHSRFSIYNWVDNHILINDNIPTSSPMSRLSSTKKNLRALPCFPTPSCTHKALCYENIWLHHIDVKIKIIIQEYYLDILLSYLRIEMHHNG